MIRSHSSGEDRPLKRVAIFTTDDFIPPAGGAELALGEIIRRNPDIHFDVFCAKLFKGRPSIQEVNNATIIRFGWAQGLLDKLWFLWRGPSIAYHRHKREPYDAAWSLMASWGGLATVRFYRRTKLPYLLTLQEGDSLEDLQNKIRPIKKRFEEIFRSAKAVQAISHFLSEWGTKMGYNGPLSVVIPNGVDGARFAKPILPEQRLTIRGQWGLGADDVALFTSSRLVKKNGVGDVIEALPHLPTRVHFFIAGFGPLELSLRQRVQELNLGSRVHFLGMVSQADLPSLLQASDIFVRPSLTEGLGNSFLEAMAARVPVIATPVGGIPDFLTEGETGFFCEPENPESVATTVRRVLALPREVWKTVLDQAQHMVLSRYQWDKIAQDMRQLLEQVAKE